MNVPDFCTYQDQIYNECSFYLFSSGRFLCMLNCHLPNLENDGLSHLSQRL